MPDAAARTGRKPTPADNAAVDAARSTVATRKLGRIRRRAKSMTVDRARGRAETLGTTEVAHIATMQASPHRVQNSSVNPPYVTNTPPSNGPSVYPRPFHAP